MSVETRYDALQECNRLQQGEYSDVLERLYQLKVDHTCIFGFLRERGRSRRDPQDYIGA